MNAEEIKNLIGDLGETEETDVLQEFKERLGQMSDAERSNLKNSDARKLLREVRSRNPQAMARQRAIFLGANVPFNS